MSNTAEVVERYAAGGPLLAYAMGGLTREHETARPGPGAWSIAELVGHLLDSDLVYADRIKRVISEHEPTLQYFDENAWLVRLDSHNMPVEEAVNLFAANRHWVARILRKLPPSDFARVGIHSEAGRQDLAYIVGASANHLDHHLRFLYGKRDNLGAPVPPRYTGQ